MFRKLHLFPSADGGRETPTLLAPLERANLGPVFEASFFYGRTDRVSFFITVEVKRAFT
jgi:hypothetical protein